MIREFSIRLVIDLEMLKQVERISLKTNTWGGQEFLSDPLVLEYDAVPVLIRENLPHYLTEVVKSSVETSFRVSGELATELYHDVNSGDETRHSKIEKILNEIAKECSFTLILDNVDGDGINTVSNTSLALIMAEFKEAMKNGEINPDVIAHYSL
jgi:hypothetical protein